jgi:flagellar motor component MotA
VWYNITNKEVIDMTRDEFIAEYYKVSAKAVQFSEKARREGLLGLEDFIDYKKADQRDILEYGLIFVIDGTDAAVIRDILSLIIDQEEDKYAHLLMNLKMEAVLSIQSGDNTRVLAYKLNAHTDLTLTDDPIMQKMKYDRDDKGRFTKEEIDALIGGLDKNE